MANITRNNSRLHELEHIIRTSCAEVIIVTEAELGQDDVFVIPGFNVFRSSPAKNGKSRLLALVKDSIPALMDRKSPMDIWLTLNSSTAPLTIAGVYRQWRENEQIALETFYSNCAAALKSSKILVLGDFNLDVMRVDDYSYSRASMAANFIDKMESMGYFFSGPSSPTYCSYGTYNGSKRTSTIDLVFAHGLAPSVTVLDFASTDHRPVLATVVTKRTAPSATTTNAKYTRNLRRVSSAAFCQAIDANLPSNFYQETNLEAAHLSLVSAITAALDMLAPLRLAKPKHVKGFNLSLADDTLEAIRQRDSTSPAHPLFRTLRNRATKLVRRDAVTGAMRTIDAASDNPKKLWDFAKRHMGYVCPSLPTTLSASNMNSYFIQKIEKIRQEIPTATTLDKSTTLATAEKFNFKFPSAGKTREVIRSLRNTGALGSDGIGVASLKLGADAIAAPLAHIARMSFQQGKFPSGFKMAIVTPVYKGRGKPAKEESSYRPVSILPAMSKVLEKLVLEPLTSHVSQLLPNSQFGFRPKRSSVAAIASAHGAWSKAKALKKTVVVAAYDMSSAFDTIDVNLLCTRLEEFGICGTPNQWFRSYLTDRRQRVTAHGALSESHPVPYGVPQGSILGPLLFLVMMAGFPDFVDIKANMGGTIGYADDICCWVTADNDIDAVSELERISSRLLEYAAVHKLSVNKAKTQIMWVRSTAGPCVTVGDASVTDSKSLDLLGVSFDKGLKSTPYLKAQASATKRIRGAIAALSRHLPAFVVTKVARALVLGKSGYGAPAAISPRLDESDPVCSAVAAVQVAINNVARSALRVNKKDKIPIGTLLRNSSLPSLNRLTVRGLALETWKAIRVCDGPSGEPNPLGCLIGTPGQGPRFTRTVAASHLPPPLKCAMPTFVWYSYMLWNSHTCLREATTLSEAKKAADHICNQVPM